jgi:hypothetical protein
MISISTLILLFPHRLVLFINNKKYIIRELNPGLNDGNVEFYH